MKPGRKHAEVAALPRGRTVPIRRASDRGTPAQNAKRSRHPADGIRSLHGADLTLVHGRTATKAGVCADNTGVVRGHVALGGGGASGRGAVAGGRGCPCPNFTMVGVAVLAVGVRGAGDAQVAGNATIGALNEARLAHALVACRGRVLAARNALCDKRGVARCGSEHRYRTLHGHVVRGANTLVQSPILDLARAAHVLCVIDASRSHARQEGQSGPDPIGTSCPAVLYVLPSAPMPRRDS